MDDTGTAIIVWGIVLGMQFIHSQGVIHRDLKPVTIVLHTIGSPGIGNLDSSRVTDLDVTLTGEVGSLMYTAAEMCEDAPYMAAIDVDSFTLILYELVVGKTVFREWLSPSKLVKSVLDSRRPELPESLNETVKRIIARGGQTYSWSGRHSPSPSPDLNKLTSKSLRP
jgi:serine/threonine protein kinase